jgi:hypothetical protein
MAVGIRGIAVRRAGRCRGVSARHERRALKRMGAMDRILNAIERLQAQKPTAGEAVHRPSSAGHTKRV